ncbi:C40 family peptidase [Clostridium sp. DL1XJH146]
MHKRVTALILSITILASISQSSIVFATPNYDSQLEEQKAELAEHKTEYDEAKKVVEGIEAEIEKLDVEIEAMLSQIEETETNISELETKIQKAKDDIAQAEKDMQDEKDMYNSRMVAMYETGGTSYLEIILGASDLSDLLSRIQTIKTLSDLDKEIIAELKEKQAEIEEQKANLTEENNTLIDYRKTLLDKKETLDSAKDDQQVLIDDAKKEANSIAVLVQSDQQEVNKTMSLIEAAREATPSYDPSRGATSISSNAVVAYASNYLGRPYRYGATGPSSFDCSGFAQYVFRHFGVSLPRTSSSQSRYGTYVSRENLQPGDLVFFGYPVHHVGIYVGNNSYIHSPHTGDVVKISTLSSRSDFNCGRRVY